MIADGVRNLWKAGYVCVRKWCKELLGCGRERVKVC
jgi:hypothetical protein